MPMAYYLTKLNLLCKLDKLCEMCAMALVHSRLQHLFVEEGRVGEESTAILCSQQLNHRVLIFHLTISKD